MNENNILLVCIIITMVLCCLTLISIYMLRDFIGHHKLKMEIGKDVIKEKTVVSSKKEKKPYVYNPSQDLDRKMKGDTIDIFD